MFQNRKTKTMKVSLAKGEALERGIFKELSFLKRRNVDMKVLIADNNKTLAEILALKILQNLNIESEIVSTYEEARELIEVSEDYYSIALVDLDLFDDRSEELIDLTIKNSIATIVMIDSSESIKRIENKDIVDYILKDRSETIDYMISTIDRVLKNRDITILVAESNKSDVHAIEKILKAQLLNVLIVSDGIQAVNTVRKNRNIKLVITAYDIPKANGIELTIALRKAFGKDELPIIGIAKDNICATKFLKYGVNDLIKAPYFKDELSVRINNVLEAKDNVDKLKHYADTDYLTQLPNRKYFYKEMNSFYKKSKKEKTPFALAMVDIDDFKYVNDTYGHSVGDRAIKALAEEIRNNIKGRDIVARFGGEEFCIVLKDIKESVALRFLDGIRKNIENITIDGENGEQVKFTVSIGFTTDFGKNLDDMIKISDNYLYRAKRSGKNRVCSPLKEEEAVLV